MTTNEFFATQGHSYTCPSSIHLYEKIDSWLFPLLVCTDESCVFWVLRCFLQNMSDERFAVKKKVLTYIVYTNCSIDKKKMYNQWWSLCWVNHFSGTLLNLIEWRLPFNNYLTLMLLSNPTLIKLKLKLHYMT